jgi:hypothetical protein
MITRRRVLLGGLAVVVVAGVGVIGIGPRAAESHIVTVVRRKLSFLKLDEKGLQAFAKDQVSALLAKRPTWNRLKYHYLSMFAKQFTRYNRSNDKRTRIQRMEDNFASTYLLSSDFFLNGADESRIVQYVNFYDPLRACGNPFWRPAIDTRSAS